MSDLFIGQTSFPYLGERRFRGLGDVRPVHRPCSSLSDLKPRFPILVKGGSEVWMMSDLFIGQTLFKTFRPQTSFPYLGERRFRGGSEVWVMSDLFMGQTLFKIFRLQTSFPYLGERRFRGLGDVRPVHGDIGIGDRYATPTYLASSSEIDARICELSLLETLGGVTDSRNNNVQEKVAMFLTILSHHTKSRSMRFEFKRLGHTVSKHFHSVLNAVLRLHSIFLVEPEAVPDDSTDPRWGSFKGCVHWMGHTLMSMYLQLIKGDIGTERVMLQSINEMAKDPLEHLVDEFMHRQQMPEGQGVIDYIDNEETSTEWNNWRDALAQNMFNEWSNRG
ncbi:hypothetical protein ACS0TY_034435 [Phlomoides rotata]